MPFAHLAADVSPMTTYLNDISSFFDSAFSWCGQLGAFVTTRPALIVLVLAMPIVGFSVGLLRRLINVN